MSVVQVALSVGHLASLYNYHMQEYTKAEQLYLRSIKIGRKLFGPSYSGLEYDYRGLIQVYHLTRNYEKFLEYQAILDQWRISREAKAAEQVSLLVFHQSFSNFGNTFQGEKVEEENSSMTLKDLIQTVTQVKDEN